VASNAGGGLGAKGSATISIVNSVFTGNGTQAISFRLVGSATVQFCTIAYNTNSPGVQSDAQTMLAIDSTILYANGAAANGQLLCNGGCTPIYSLFSNVPAPPGTGNVSGDPQFASVNGQDFHIALGSPADNAGDPAASTAIDFDGNPRPQPAGSPPDIGAFEVP